ncbi:putative transcriptional regulator [Rhizobium rosettiformans]|uniref:Helix-turn-helix transcriptional regulator n=2 Tax=Rhizobium rosettiformans TaxID=1368430 RepID=A0A4S8PZ22_9HYPH|nr:helix-turn-helix transcriptional regulator [Rhizobium rosettiformans]MBB5276278.1 putative transcriptional regulator [Rhizobium rosettiformans]THV36910.1 helix-turn-helix transcriptional regulator [Rhizobium rosettiformans W3]
MGKPKHPEVLKLSYEQIVALQMEHGSQRKMAEALGIPRSTLQNHLKELKSERFVSRRQKEARRIPVTDKVQYFIVTSAQDNTLIHTGFWDNLNAYADHLGAEIIVSGFTYNKSLFEDHTVIASSFMPEVLPHMEFNQVLIGDGLTICCEMNTLPTAVHPLSGFDTYTGDRWGVFPHPKVHLKSIPTAKGDPAKIILTTGSVTLPNYVQKKAGIKAEHHHEVGAVIIELLPNGKFFVRHLLAEDDGSFQDLLNVVSAGKVSSDGTIEGITWGDVHWEKRNPVITSACWDLPAPGVVRSFPAMLDYLKPSYQFIHDLTDFEYRNHHNIKDPHFRFKMHMRNTDSVEDSMKGAAIFLKDIERDGTLTVVVESNHDLALTKWLKTADYRDDPINAEFFLRLQLQTYQAIMRGDEQYQVFPWVLRQYEDLDDVIFLSQDDSFTIAGDIECAMHGHVGANGAKASPMAFSRMGKRSNTAHTHSASIFDGNYCAGVSASLDMGYNVGLSSWSVTHIVTYPSGKRTLVTMHDDGLYCAAVMDLAALSVAA